jgi:FHA domain
LPLKTRSSDSDVALDTDDELGSMSPSKDKEPKTKARKAKTKRAKPAKKSAKRKEPTDLETPIASTSDTSIPSTPIAEPSTSALFSEEEDTTEPAPPEAKPFYVIGGAGDSRRDDTEQSDLAGPSITEPSITEPSITPQFLSSAEPEPSVATQGQYYLVFVNTPAQSLIKSKVQVHFEIFPTVAIGRDAENVVVIPDTEVSRSHAELSLDGNRVMLKDRGSTNGTYLFDGKEFQKINGTVEVKPNTMIKFGNNTIVKLTCE